MSIAYGRELGNCCARSLRQHTEKPDLSYEPFAENGTQPMAGWKASPHVVCMKLFPFNILALECRANAGSQPNLQEHNGTHQSEDEREQSNLVKGR